MVRIIDCKCLKCGHEWSGLHKDRRPTLCPACRNKMWWRPRRGGLPPTNEIYREPEISGKNQGLTKDEKKLKEEILDAPKKISLHKLEDLD